MSRLKEEWRPVVGFEGRYEVSDWGNVASLNYNHTGKWGLLSLTPNHKGGYLRVILCKDGKKYYQSVHRLVYEAFVGEIPEGLEVNHMDEDKNNCAVWNLNLLTRKQNNDWGTRNERASKALTNHPAISKAVVAKNPITLKVVYEFPSTMEAERSGGYEHSRICACCNGKQKTHKGLIWQWA